MRFSKEIFQQIDSLPIPHGDGASAHLLRISVIWVFQELGMVLSTKYLLTIARLLTAKSRLFMPPEALENVNRPRAYCRQARVPGNRVRRACRSSLRGRIAIFRRASPR